MPRIRVQKNNYTSGELTPALYGRTDNKHYFNGAKKLRNVIPIPQGGWRIRGGLAHVDTVPDNGGGSPSETRLIAYNKSITQRYLLMLYDEAYKVYLGGELKKTVTGEPWSDDKLDEIAWSQDLDTLLVFHETWQPRAIQRQGSDTAWSSFYWPLKNIPRFEYDDVVYTNGVDEVQELDFQGGSWTTGDDFTLTAGGEETKAIQYSTVIATLAANIQAALRELKVTSDDGITCSGAGTKVTVTFGGDDGGQPWGEMVAIIKTDPSGSNRTVLESVTTKGEYPGEDVISDARGWPRCGTFFGGRLWMGGSTGRPNLLLATRVGDEQDLLDNQTRDDYAINVALDSDDVASIHAIFGGRHLQIFTSSSEWYVPVSDTDRVTPENIAARRTTNRGSKIGLPVFDIEGVTVFVQSTRDQANLGVALREFVFSDTEAAYLANDISLLASHLINDPQRIAVRRATSTDDCDYWLAANADGNMVWFCTLRGQEVNAFAVQETDGDFKDVAVDGQEVYVVTERLDKNGMPVRFLEVFVEGLYVDCGKYDFAVSAPVTSVDMSHLIGRTVEIQVDGIWYDPQVVPDSGTVTLPETATTSYQVGLAWPIVDAARGLRFVAEDLPFETDLPSGTTVGKKRRIVEVDINVRDTPTLLVNGNRIHNRRFGDDALDTDLPAMDGNVRKRGLKGWDYEGTVAVGDKVPGRAEVRSITKVVAV